jgi:hypothetical protein
VRNDIADREDDIAGQRRKLLTDLDSRMIMQTRFDDILTIERQAV